MNDTPTNDQILDIIEHFKQLAQEAAETHGEVALFSAITIFVGELITHHLPNTRDTAAQIVCEEIMKAVTPA